MGDGAHVGPTTHEVFNQPYKVRPETEYTKPPSNYKRRRLPVEPKIPDKMEIWHVQRSGKDYGGVVSRAYGFTDSPDAEALVLGLNIGKEYGAVGIGRHGNVLQWGYSAPPSQMTDAGKKLFINCICYIAKFNGKLPLVRSRGYPREHALREGILLNRMNDKELQYYTENLELIYRDKNFQIDKELQELGIPSNRKIATLETLIELLDDPEKSKTAEIALKRYTDMSFNTSGQWLEQNRDRIFFSDFGGYKFSVVPEGYLENK